MLSINQIIAIVILFGSQSFYSQITIIPDPVFEQKLIDLGIDSDGMVNGQVLTSDIESILSLNLFASSITDLTGLEDFASLEYLNVSGNELELLDVSNNIQLKELYCDTQEGTFTMFFDSLDLSNNIHLENLEGNGLIFLESLNLKNGNNSILTVSLPCFLEGEPCELINLHCVMVDDETAATNNEFPYDDWFIQADYIYSEDCSLSVPFYMGHVYSVFPTPTHGLLNIYSSKMDIQKIEVFDTSGKNLMTESQHFEQIDLSEFDAGIFLLKIQTANGFTTKKVIKE